MMQNRRTRMVYALLGVAWVLIAGWQGLEHIRFTRKASDALLERASEIGSTLGVVIRSQGRFFGVSVIRQSRLMDALNELVKYNDLQAVMLLNSGGQVVASAGQPIGLSLDNLDKQMVIWGKEYVTKIDLVDLGGNAQNDVTSAPRAIVLNEDRPEGRSDGRSEGRSPDRYPGRPPFPGPEREASASSESMMMRPPFPEGGPGGDPDRRPTSGTESFLPPLPPLPPEAMTSSGMTILRMAYADPNSTAAQTVQRWRREYETHHPRRRPVRFGRPFGMDEEHYRRMLEKQGLHAFVLQMPTDSYAAEARNDLWIRGTTLFIALLAVGGLGFAWRNMERMDRLQMRLLRESEMNAHLQELNVAAAGLAHETRNPLNIVRGLAQIISQNPGVPGEVRQKAGEITAEVDRVTSRLNEFITYSRAPEPRPAPTRLLSIIADVQRALDTDLQENEIVCAIKGPDLTVQADEPLMRQVLFNLLLNAIQAIGEGGRVEVSIQTCGNGTAALEVRDNGPGIAPELCREIYKPYFTTRAEGTGLGLSVVRQIVLAHHWELEDIPGLDGGAGFRISGLKVL